MKLHYCPNTGSLHIGLQPRPGTRTWEFSDGLNTDHDESGTAMSIDIDKASLRIEIAQLVTIALP